jgi:hypothetical protein
MNKTHEDYENNIISLHNELIDYPESKTLKNRLSYRLSKWAYLLNIEIHVANNEKSPWESHEIGYPIVSMVDKKSSGNYNVADYQAFIKNYNQWCGLLVERKGGKIGVEDFYGTLMNRQSRDRFYREIQRYEDDNRFSQMIIMVEGTMQDFLKYAPKFTGKIYNKNHVGANVESRRATIAGLYARGIPVLWCGSREQAVKIYPQLVKQWIVKHYDELIGI